MKTEIFFHGDVLLYMANIWGKKSYWTLSRSISKYKCLSTLRLLSLWPLSLSFPHLHQLWWEAAGATSFFLSEFYGLICLWNWFPKPKNEAKAQSGGWVEQERHSGRGAGEKPSGRMASEIPSDPGLKCPGGWSGTTIEACVVSACQERAQDRGSFVLREQECLASRESRAHALCSESFLNRARYFRDP